MNTPRQVVSAQEIYRGRRLVLIEERLRLASGAEVVRERIEHPGAVVVLPFLDDGRVMLIRQWRQALGMELLELPAGTLERGEPPVQCAARELTEEIGYRAERLQPLGVLRPAPGFCDEIQHLFIARGLHPERAEPDIDEVITCSPMSPEELRRRVETGEIVDAKTLACCLRAALLGELHW